MQFKVLLRTSGIKKASRNEITKYIEARSILDAFNKARSLPCMCRDKTGSGILYVCPAKDRKAVRWN